MTESDNPSGESGDLDINGAAAAFSALMGDEEPEEPKVDTEVEDDPPKKEEEEEAVEEGADAPITIMVDGKQVTLTQAQLADAYKNGLRQSDYTQKTMAVAEQRKAAEAETQKAQQERQTYAQNLTKMAAQLEGAIQQQAQIDWGDLLKTDPIQYLEQKALLERRQAALQQNESEQARIAEATRAEEAQARQNHLKDQERALLDTLPQWKDEATATKEKEAIKSDLLKRGYTAEQIGNLSDSKTVVMAREAMLYRQMMAKANVAAKKLETVPEKVVRPGVSGTDRPRQIAGVPRTGSLNIDQAAKVFGSLI